MSELPIADFRLAIEDRALRQPVACHSKPRKFQIDIRRRPCHESTRVQSGPEQNSIERSYELAKILHRFHRGVRLPLRVWLPLVRNLTARCTSGSADPFKAGSRP